MADILNSNFRMADSVHNTDKMLNNVNNSHKTAAIVTSLDKTVTEQERVAINNVLPLKAARPDAIANLKSFGAQDTSNLVSLVFFTFSMRRHLIPLASYRNHGERLQRVGKILSYCFGILPNFVELKPVPKHQHCQHLLVNKDVCKQL